jgi:hypothetical protein
MILARGDGPPFNSRPEQVLTMRPNVDGVYHVKIPHRQRNREPPALDVIHIRSIPKARGYLTTTSPSTDSKTQGVAQVNLRRANAVKEISLLPNVQRCPCHFLHGSAAFPPTRDVHENSRLAYPQSIAVTPTTLTPILCTTAYRTILLHR